MRHLPGPYTGRAAARNAGIAAARAPVVLFTDADIIASPDLLVAAPRAPRRAGRPRAVVGMEVQVDSYDDYLRKRADRATRDAAAPARRASASRGCTSSPATPRCRGRELDRVGRFDEDFTGYGHEDLELGYRLQARAASPIVYEPRAVELPLASRAVRRTARQHGARRPSTVRFYRKHPTFGVQAAPRHDAGLARAARRRRRAPRRSRRGSKTAPRRPGFARTLSYQYHYLTGVKAALRGDELEFASRRAARCAPPTSAARSSCDGWVHRRRDHGGLIFIDVRDRDGLTQMVFDPSTAREAVRARRSRCAASSSCSVRGTRAPRVPPGTENAKLATGEVEVAVDDARRAQRAR